MKKFTILLSFLIIGCGSTTIYHTESCSDPQFTFDEAMEFCGSTTYVVWCGYGTEDVPAVACRTSDTQTEVQTNLSCSQSDAEELFAVCNFPHN